MKQNKKGISLIVLVITIIVIIILAAAVILTLTSNNPIGNANAAKQAQNKDSIESAINLFVATKIASTEGVYDTAQIITGSTAGTASMKIVTGTAAVTVATKSLWPIDTAAVKTVVGLDVPTTPNSAWYIEASSCKVYLVFDAGTQPTYLSTASYPFILSK